MAEGATTPATRGQQVVAMIGELQPQSAAGAKFFRRLHATVGTDGVCDLMARLAALPPGTKLDPHEHFHADEYKLYRSTWPKLFSRRHAVGGGMALAGVVMSALGGAEVMLDTDAADRERPRRKSGRLAQQAHNKIHGFVAPSLIAGGVATFATGSYMFDHAKLHEVADAITQMAMLEVRAHAYGEINSR